MKDARLYLLHISECIQKVEDYTSGGKENFLADSKTQDGLPSAGMESTAAPITRSLPAAPTTPGTFWASPS